MLQTGWCRRRIGATLVLISLLAPGVVIGATATPALAKEVPFSVVSPSLPVVSSLADLRGAIDVRIRELDQLSRAVAASSTLTKSNSGALNTLLSNEIAGLSTLELSAESDTTASELAADARTMVLTYRVYSIVLPVVQTVIRADVSHAAAARIAALIPSIKTTIVASTAPSVRLARAKSLLATLPRLVTSIDATLAGVTAKVLALNPQNARPSSPTLNAAVSASKRAKNEVNVAYATVGRIIVLVAGANAPSSRRR